MYQLDGGGVPLPDDLKPVNTPALNKDYFDITIPGLKIDQTYSFQFQYINSDGTTSEWSPGYILTTNTEDVPGAPTATVPSTSTGNIPVTLSTFPTNSKRVDIYVIGGIYGSGKVVDSFFSAGTKTISIADPGVYEVVLISVTPSGINGDPTLPFTITVASATPEEIVPATIISATATAGVNPLDSSGQLGYIDISIINGTIPSVFGGYIVSIQNDSNTWTQAFESKTALSNLYVNAGIMVGSSYTLSVATTNGKVRSEYVSVTGSPISVTDTRTNTSTVSGSLSFSATDSILTVSWGASTEVQVDSYRVQVTSNSDTTFSSPLQTIYTKSTNTSFGGLTANTTYRVRVTTRYGGSSGILSTSHTSGTFTLDSSGAISDGVAPTTNPVITTSNIKSLFGAFAITFPSVTNSDAVTYEVFIKPTNSTGIVSNTYKVLEISGTFAVIKTLADKTTALTYGTDYYIAIRAKDNDGVSTGTVTPVGPVQTTQVENADLAADSVYANNIKAGEIDASKMVTDLLFASKTINVGESTSLNRIRLDGVAATVSGAAIKSRMFIGAGNYYDSSTSFFVDNTGRFSIADKLKYDATGGLVIDGSGTFAGLLTTGSGLNTIKVGTGVNGSNNGIYIGATSDYIYTNGTLRLANGAITYSGGTLTVTGNITANALAANTSISGATGTFTGQLNVGSVTVATITGASGDGSKVTYTANNSLFVGDVVSISGIAQNGPFGTAPNQYYTTNAYNISNAVVTDVTATTFKVASSVVNSSTQSYTSGGSVTGSGFKVYNTGLISANGGKIGGWEIDGTQLKSSGSNYISLNPITPRITLFKSGTGSITIDPIEGIKDSAGNFTLTPGGTLTLRGSITSGSSITGAIIQSPGNTYVKIDGVSYPGTIQLYADGYATPGFIDVSGSWPTNEFTLGQISISPPIAAGHTGPVMRLYSDVDGGWAGLVANTIVLGDSTLSTSGGRLDGSWEINVTDGSSTGLSGATKRQLRNISAWQGSGPPSGNSFITSQIGDIVLFYT